MAGINLRRYPKILDMIQDVSLVNKMEHIKWIGMSKSEAAVLIAEMHQMAKAGVSDHLPLRQRSKRAANFYHGAVGRGLHVFAQEQGKLELGLNQDEVKQLFSHRSFLGGLHPVSYVELPLEDSNDV